MNLEVIAFIYINSIDAILKNLNDKKTENGLAATMKEYAFYHLHGIVSNEGLHYLNNHLKNHLQ
jgi:hypothetical protein